MSDEGATQGQGRIPGLPEGYQSVTWEQFNGLNTKPPRPAIADTECFWLDGWMPIGPSNLRTLWGTGAIGYTANTGNTVLDFGFGNIDDARYGWVLADDGSVDVFNVTTGVATNIMLAGTILSPTSIFGFSQWGSKYLIFSASQTNGYWLWDGVNVYTAGTLGPSVTLDAAGDNYTGQPEIVLATTGSGTTPVFTADIENGSIARIRVVDHGSGYAVGDFATINISGGGTDNQASLLTTVSTTTGGLSEVYVINGGSGYSSATFARVTGDGGTGSGATVSLAIQNGTITSAAIATSGYNFTGATIEVVDPGIPGQKITGGSGGQIGVAVAFGQITSIAVNDGGTGYVGLPVIKIIGDGTGAVAVPTISGGKVTGTTMTSYGSGYTKALAVVQGGNNAANATPIIMPFGISGTAVEVYEDRVWITNGASPATFPPKGRTIFSDPRAPDSFSNGGGAFASTDSFVRVGYHGMKQSNGFLYLIGDSSLNYISGVQTTAPTGSTVGAAVTTFSNVNVDPQFGSPWPSSVQVFSRNIVFANTVGVFVSYGGAVTKASLPLDGFYASGSIFGETANFSSAVAHIFGIPVYMLLLPVMDQITGQIVNKLLMWDGKKWFTSSQDRTLNFIATQEINSVLTAWGTDGTNIFPLFQNPTTSITKTVRSKLYSTPAYWTTKVARGLTGVVNAYASDQPISVAVDNENGDSNSNSTQSIPITGSSITWQNNSLATVAWQNNAVATVTWGSSGLQVFGPYPFSQTGRMIGLTVTTTASDIALLSVNLGETVESANVF